MKYTLHSRQSIRDVLNRAKLIMKHPRSVWLVRHGQTDWNLQRRYLSNSDRPLTPFGRRQITSLRAFFAHRRVDVVIHSGLSRTEQAAIAIVGSRDLPLVSDPRWREASHGDWEGLTYREVARRFPEDASRRFTDPLNEAPSGGESLKDMVERVMDAWSNLGECYPDRRIVVVTHATPIQAILCRLTGVPLHEHWRWRVDLSSATGIDCYPGTAIIRAINTVPALK